MNKHYEIIKTFDTLDEFLKYNNEHYKDEDYDGYEALYTFIKHLESRLHYYMGVIENMGNKEDIDW